MQVCCRGAMLKRSRQVEEIFHTLDRITDEITSSMSEMTAGMQEISTAVNAVNDLSAENRDVVTSLMGEVNRFQI